MISPRPLAVSSPLLLLLVSPLLLSMSFSCCPPRVCPRCPAARPVPSLRLSAPCLPRTVPNSPRPSPFPSVRGALLRGVPVATNCELRTVGANSSPVRGVSANLPRAVRELLQRSSRDKTTPSRTSVRRIVRSGVRGCVRLLRLGGDCVRVVVVEEVRRTPTTEAIVENLPDAFLCVCGDG